MHVLVATVLPPSAAQQCMTGAACGLDSHLTATPSYPCVASCARLTEKAMRSIRRVLPAIPDEAVPLLPFIQMSVSGESI